ncbi:MAG: ATP-binding protein [Olsenella sp.]|jgi:hypothetical protein|nr:ATP-binding protein [Olsenella sp.]
MAADGRRPLPEAPPGTAPGGAGPRRGRIIGSQTGRAGLPCARAPRDPGWPCRPSVPGAGAGDPAAPGFVDRHEDATSVGGPGVGKAHLAVAPGAGAAGHRRPARSVGRRRLAGDLERAADRGQPGRRTRLCSRPSPPMLGGPGCPQVGRRGADPASRPASRGHGRGSTVAATSVGMGMRAGVLGNAVTASAMAGGPCHHCHPMRVTGRSHGTRDLPAGSLSGEGAGTESG